MTLEREQFAVCLGGLWVPQLCSQPLLLGKTTPKLPAAPVMWSAGIILVFVMDGCSICCLGNPFQSPFSSPGCYFTLLSMKGDQIENVSVVLGKER